MRVRAGEAGRSTGQIQRGLWLAATGIVLALVAGAALAGHAWVAVLGLLALGFASAAAVLQRRSLQDEHDADAIKVQVDALRHLRSVLDALPVAVADLDAKLRFRFVNAAHEDWFDASNEALVGRALVAVLGPQARQFYPAVERALRGERATVDAVLACRNGRKVVKATLVPSGGGEEPVSGFLAVMVDVTEETRAREQERFLARATSVLFSELDYKATLRSIADLAVPTLADWAAVEVIQDDGSVDQVGIAHDDSSRLVLGAEIRRRYPPREDRPGVGRVLRTGVSELRSSIDEDDLAAITDDESHLDLLRRMGPASSVVVPMIAHGKILGAIALYTTKESGRRYTESDRLFVEELARRAATAIENATLYDLATKAVTAREELLAIVAHDLRNPLGVIQMKSEMMKELIDTLPEKRGLNIDVIQRAAKRMDRLIAALADATRLRAERLTMEFFPCDLLALSRESIEVLETLAGSKGVSLEVVSDDDMAVVWADQERVLQVLFNLIGNAIKFTPRGGRVVVRVIAAGDGMVQVDVSDTGPGIPAVDLEHIFDRFWQATPGRRSAGLGLYIARGIVQAHHGLIWADSQLGTGSTFHFTLPVPPVVRHSPDDMAHPLHWTERSTPVPH